MKPALVEGDRRGVAARHRQRQQLDLAACPAARDAGIEQRGRCPGRARRGEPSSPRIVADVADLHASARAQQVIAPASHSPRQAVSVNGHPILHRRRARVGLRRALAFGLGIGVKASGWAEQQSRSAL